MSGRLGVCSWSLRPHTPEELAQSVRDCGLDAVQLALDPIRDGRWDEARTRKALGAAGVTVLSGMMAMKGEDYSTLESIRRTGGVRPDSTWKANLEAARHNAAIGARLGLRLVTFHAGFLPHDRRDAERRTMLDRIEQLAEIFGASGMAIALETGQETAATLLDVLAGLGDDRIGVNFDPANMILYGMGDPVAALRTLGPRVRQIHIKDALPSPSSGEWGSETVVGSGAVPWGEFLEAACSLASGCDLVLEREGGEHRIADVKTGRLVVETELARMGRCPS